MNKKKYQFIFNWILIKKLAIGNSPKEKDNISLLINKGVKNILALCSESEAEWCSDLSKNFKAKRIVLPDSRTKDLPTFNQLKEAYDSLDNFLNDGITFIHCYASIERSPMLCIMYIMKNYKLNLEEALDYVLRKHKYTNPKNNQLSNINQFTKKLDIQIYP